LEEVTRDGIEHAYTYYNIHLTTSLQQHNMGEAHMSVENVKEFYKRLEEDEAFRTEIAKDETLKDITMDKLIAVAGKHGYEFAKADFEMARNELKEKFESGELSESELEKVTGGIGLGICFVPGVGLWGPGAPDRAPGPGSDRLAFCLIIGFQVR
jgi:predicted ribosomally synthesized peptide with nif11-like leader